MEPTTAEPTALQPIRGYSRAEVDEFLRAASEERDRLAAEIADSSERISRARAANGLHRVMVAMLLEAQRELTEIRTSADAEATRILADAEREATMILAGDDVAPSATPASALPTGAMIDLGALGREGMSRFEGGTTDDPYMQNLRSALADDAPLRPLPE
jgi:hypothetical protein